MQAGWATDIFLIERWTGMHYKAQGSQMPGLKMFIVIFNIFYPYANSDIFCCYLNVPSKIALRSFFSNRTESAFTSIV